MRWLEIVMHVKERSRVITYVPHSSLGFATRLELEIMFRNSM